MSDGATAYVASDERIGTEFFISELRGAKTRLRSNRLMRACVDQTMNFPTFYFSNYLLILRMSYLKALPNMADDQMMQLSGLLKLAAASLPGVRADIRRELRRRGRDNDALIVCDSDLENKDRIFTGSILTIGA